MLILEKESSGKCFSGEWFSGKCFSARCKDTDKSKFKSEDFCDDVQSKFFAYIINMPDLDCDNVNDSFNGFENLLRSIIDDHAPLKRLSRRQRKLRSKPCLMKGIHISIRNRQTMFRPLFLLGNNSEKTFYRKYSIKLNKIIALSKKKSFLFYFR